MGESYKRIYVTTPYFMPLSVVWDIIASLTASDKDGVKIRKIFNITDDITKVLDTEDEDIKRILQEVSQWKQTKIV